MKRKILLALLYALLASGALPHCYAEPDSDDVDRVKRHFLSLRFQATFDPELRLKDDLQLFQLSCQKNRVKCDRVLNMLKMSDITFYTRLIEK